MTEQQRRARAKIKSWRENPAKMVREEFHVEPDKWQLQVLEAFADPKIQRIGMQACVGPGKTTVMSWCIWNFLSCYGNHGEHPKGAAVSITATNLADNLWPELAKWQSRSEYFKSQFTWTKTRVFANSYPEDWFMAARSFSKTANEEELGRTLSGLHGKYVMGVLDESGDIPVQVAKAAEQALSTKPLFGKILQAGNPSSRKGILFAAATTLRDLWHMVRITGDPDDPDRSQRIDLEWAKIQIEKFGRDNPWIKYSILGEFPESDINVLISPDLVEKAMLRKYRESDYFHIQRRLGVDVALQGDDRTVLFPRQGLMAFKPVVMRTQEPADISARVISARLKFRQEIDFVDNTGGWGSGVVSHLNQSEITNGSVHPVEFAGKAIDPAYANKRAEMWFEILKWLKDGGRLPPEPELVKELTAPTYSLSKGRLLLEPKEKIKERLKFSPDMADALALTFALPDMPRGKDYSAKEAAEFFERGRCLHEYDPLG